jgi:Macro domain
LSCRQGVKICLSYVERLQSRKGQDYSRFQVISKIHRPHNWTILGGGGEDEDELLAFCHRSALAIAVRYEARSIAFPAIFTGIYGFPEDRAANIAMTTVKINVPSSIELAVFPVASMRKRCSSTPNILAFKKRPPQWTA